MGPGPRDPGPREPGTRDPGPRNRNPLQSLKVEPRTPLKFKSETPGAPLKV